MGLEAVQSFLTTYLRDPRFRQQYRAGGADELERKLSLEPGDRKLIREINLDDLDRAAEDIRRERLAKRTSEFKPFLDHLAPYGPVQQFLFAFDAANTTGLQARSMEMDRFVSFSTEQILTSGLPGYLLDLLRFCHHFCQLADAPREPVPGALEKLPERGLATYHRIELRRPYRVVAFRYNALRIAQSEPSTRLAAMPPEPTKLFLQKSWTAAKRTLAFSAAELPLLPILLEGTSSVLDLVAHLGAPDIQSAVSHLHDLFDRGMIDVTLPKHLIDDKAAS